MEIFRLERLTKFGFTTPQLICHRVATLVHFGSLFDTGSSPSEIDNLNWCQSYFSGKLRDIPWYILILSLRFPSWSTALTFTSCNDAPYNVINTRKWILYIYDIFLNSIKHHTLPFVPTWVLRYFHAFLRRNYNLWLDRSCFQLGWSFSLLLLILMSVH